jgi:hypothetical protein
MKKIDLATVAVGGGSDYPPPFDQSSPEFDSLQVNG